MAARRDAMSLYERYLLPTLVHRTCSSSKAAEQRAKVVPLARNVLALLEGAGFESTEMGAAYLPGWSVASYQYRGTAVLR
ncbi:MAG TPA: hypothetical protein VLH75_10180 [Longimicrobiales bacterium]|nr:hypothetical protein [Longimicrobiales bacterium]